jgi:HK97 gp10 family phage protein
MNVTVTLEGQAEFDAKIAAIISKASGPGLANALMEGGKLIETGCKQHAEFGRTGARYQTGHLRGSIVAEAQGENTVIVAPHTEYATYVEFGTSKMAAQPYMKPGFESSRDAAVAHIKSKLKAEMGL